MLALDYYRKHLLCPCGCGWPKEISQDPETENLATVGPPVRCHIRTAIVRAQKDVKDRPVPEGLLWGATLADLSAKPA